ncbi:binding-protein-dependent transport systems innermembrane component [Striga asiatica]|uniref:Binding-protein-dependent transport systems innermembrane component n=1 Tax=Striga asiatica TaxID=4170 RepID=A0A5A7R6P8_STRAF|nr:binding-protein-dependent transport systems innermembrane component [Striga asiatica]
MGNCLCRRESSQVWATVDQLYDPKQSLNVALDDDVNGEGNISQAFSSSNRELVKVKITKWELLEMVAIARVEGVPVERLLLSRLIDRSGFAPPPECSWEPVLASSKESPSVFESLVQGPALVVQLLLSVARLLRGRLRRITVVLRRQVVGKEAVEVVSCQFRTAPGHFRLLPIAGEVLTSRLILRRRLSHIDSIGKMSLVYKPSELLLLLPIGFEIEPHYGAPRLTLLWCASSGGTAPSSPDYINLIWYQSGPVLGPAMTLSTRPALGLGLSLYPACYVGLGLRRTHK